MSSFGTNKAPRRRGEKRSHENVPHRSVGPGLLTSRRSPRLGWSWRRTPSSIARLLLRGRLAFFAGPAAALTGVGTFRFLAGAGHERGLGASFRVFQRSYRSRGVRDVQRPLSTFRRAYLAYANTENPPGVSLCCQTRPRLSHYLPPVSPVASSLPYALPSHAGRGGRRCGNRGFTRRLLRNCLRIEAFRLVCYVIT